MSTVLPELDTMAQLLGERPAERDAAEVLAICRRAMRANRATPSRRGNVVELSGPEVADVLVSADLHGHWDNFHAVLQAADLDSHPRRHLVLQEVCHGGPEYKTGACASHTMLEAVAALKTRYPDRVHFLLSNHELSELTGHPIRKDGRLALLSFMMGLNHRYGVRAEAVHAAYMDFVASCPLGVRIGADVFVCHSVPPAVDVHGFDASVLQRPLEQADLQAHGAVYNLVWGRDYRAENAAAFAQAVGARWLVVGHTPCEAGHLVANEHELIIDCSSRPAAALLVPAQGTSSMSELVAGLIHLGEPPAIVDGPLVEEPLNPEPEEALAPLVESPLDVPAPQEATPAPAVPPGINQALHDVMKIDGALAVALLDAATGECLAKMGGDDIDLEASAAGDAALLRAKIRALERQGRATVVEEVVVALPHELQVIRPIGRDRRLMLYLLLDRESCNQALALRKLSLIERTLDA